MNWWEQDISDETKSEYVARIKYSKLLADRGNDFEAIVGSEIEKQTQYRLVTTKSFNALSVVDWIVRTNKIAELYIAIYRMNIDAVNYIKSLVSESEFTTSIILSNFFRENKKYERWTRELELFASKTEKIRLAFEKSHAKVMLCRTEDGKHIVFEGSGNLSDNARIEQYLFEDSEYIYNFHKNWMEDVFNGREKN